MNECCAVYIAGAALLWSVGGDVVKRELNFQLHLFVSWLYSSDGMALRIGRDMGGSYHGVL
jgi:hypothetical protein